MQNYLITNGLRWFESPDMLLSPWHQNQMGGQIREHRIQKPSDTKEIEVLKDFNQRSKTTNGLDYRT